MFEILQRENQNVQMGGEIGYASFYRLECYEKLKKIA